MKAVEIKAAEFGQVRSRKDHSVSFTIITPELRPSESAALLAFHGSAVRLLIEPHDVVPEENVTVDTELHHKTPSQRMRGVLYRAWEQNVNKQQNETFDAYYTRQYEKMLNQWKEQLA